MSSRCHNGPDTAPQPSSAAFSASSMLFPMPKTAMERLEAEASVPDLWDDDAPAAPTPYFDAAHGGYLLVVNSLSLFGAAAPPQPPVAATKKKVGRPPKSAGAAAKKAGIKK